VAHAAAIVLRGVKKATHKDYERYIPRWEAYLSEKGFGGFSLLENLGLTTRLVLLINFMDSENDLGHDYGKAVSAVRCHLRDNLCETSCFDHELISTARRALKPSSRVLNERKKIRARLPTPYEFVLWPRVVYWQQGDVDSKMCYLGVAVSYNYGLRSSEYSHDDKLKGEHAVMAKDVFFVYHNGDRLMPWEVTENLITGTVTHGTLSIVSSKNITDGVARTLFLSRVSPVESQLLDDILRWCWESKVRMEDMFFSRYKADHRGTVRRKRLIPRMVSVALKEAAVTFGLPAAMFSTHCNRIACASDLAAYGLIDTEIKKFIGWKSDSSLLYQRGSEKDPSALRAGATGGTLTISDVSNLVPVGRSAKLHSARQLMLSLSSASSNN